MASMFDKIKAAKQTQEPTPAKTTAPVAKANMFDKPVSKPDPVATDHVAHDIPEDAQQPDESVSDADTTQAANAGPVNSLAALGSKPPVVDAASTSGIKPDFSKATSTSGTNDVLANIELPPTPEPDATPVEITAYYLAKLNATAGHIAAGRNVLAELHGHLSDNPETKDLLLPSELGLITSVMEGLTRTAHKSAQVRKSTSQAKTAKKEQVAEKTSSVIAGMGNILG